MAGDKAATLKILGNNLDAKEKLKQIKEEADKLREDNPELTVKINRAEAAAQMAVLKEQLKGVRDEALEAEAAVASVGRGSSLATLKKAFADVDGAALGSGLLWGTGIAAAAGPGAAAVGVLSAGVLGLGSALVPAVAGLGLFGAVVKTGITDVENADKANKKLTGGLGELQTSVKSASTAWTGFTSNALKNGGASVIAKGIGLIPIALRQVQPLLSPVENALTGIIAKLGTGLKSSGFSSFIATLSTNAGPAITRVAGILGHLGDMAGKAIVAFQPLGQSILGDIDKDLGKADAGTDSGIQKFFGWLNANGPQVLGILKNLGETAKNLGKSFVSLGSLNISTFATIVNLLATISKNPIGAGVLVGLLTLIKVGSAIGPMIKLVLAFKELSGVINIAKIAMIGLDAVPIVLVITLIIAAIVLLVTHWNTVKAIAVRVWHDITGAVSTAFNWIKAHWPLLLGILTGPIGLAVLFVVTHFKQISAVAMTVVHDIGRFFGFAKTFILNAFKDAHTWLIDAGRAIVMGAVHGIESEFSAITGAIGRLADLIPSGFKKILGIFSPSRVMRSLAAQVPNGIVAGLDGGTTQVQSAANKLTNAVKSAFVKGIITENTYSGLNAYIASDTSRLKTLADKRAAIMAQIKKADAYAGSVSQTALSTASLSTIGQSITGNGGTITGAGLISGLQGSLQQINRFSADITKLRKAGLNKNLIDQIIQMGPGDGSTYAEALLSGGIGQIRQANSLEKSITQAASNLGASAANAMYDSGKSAGKGFLTGLSSQEKQISALMSKIGASMVATIRKDLGIHSPSRVMADIGSFIVDGLTLGITGRAGTAVTASQSIIRGIANPSVSVRPLGAPRAADTLTAEWIGGAGADQEFITWLKKNIRIRGGNPAVLGR